MSRPVPLVHTSDDEVSNVPYSDGVEFIRTINIRPGPSKLARGIEMGVGSPSQHAEPYEEVQSHPTISQDWTNQDTVDRNRLVALQGKMYPASHTETKYQPMKQRNDSPRVYRKLIRSKSSSSTFNKPRLTIKCPLTFPQTNWHRIWRRCRNPVRGTPFYICFG